MGMHFRHVTGISDGEAKFAGAVLAKIAQRGFPAPCSLDLERFLLEQARQVGWLTYVEDQEKGAFVFRVTSYRENLSNLLKACFFAELFLQDDEVESLLERYFSLCTPAEREFYEMVAVVVPILALPSFLLHSG
jgi:hypothetical protein